MDGAAPSLSLGHVDLASSKEFSSAILIMIDTPFPCSGGGGGGGVM
jgi:hypothetical protein